MFLLIETNLSLVFKSSPEAFLILISNSNLDSYFAENNAKITGLLNKENLYCFLSTNPKIVEYLEKNSKLMAIAKNLENEQNGFYRKKAYYHLQIYLLLYNKEYPDILINFIYKYLYELIEETYKMDAGVYQDLSYIYSEYYKYFCDQENMNWFKTLFPPSKNFFSFKHFYTGLIGRIIVCSFNPKNFSTRVFYWYGDPEDWSISYHLYINAKNELKKRKCKFIVTNFCNISYGPELLANLDLNVVSEITVLYKTHWIDKLSEKERNEIQEEYDKKYFVETYKDFLNMPNYYEYLYLDKEVSIENFTKRLLQYKENVNRKSDGYNQVLGNLWFEYKLSKKRDELELKELNKRINKKNYRIT